MADEDTQTPETALANPEGEGGAAVITRLPQDVEITDAGPCKKHVKVTVHRDAIDARLEEKYSSLMTEAPAQISGFRIGKAPRKIVERRYKTEVLSEVKNEVLMASLEQLAEEQALSPLSPPELNPGAVVIPDAGPLVYEFQIEVRPEFDLPAYKNLKLRKPVHNFTDAEVEREAKKLLEPYGQVVPKGEGSAVSLEDIITTDVVIKRGDKELNRVSEVSLKVEKQLALSDGVAANFGQAMTGAKVGETRRVDIVLSQEVTAEGMRGTNVAAEFTVKEIKTVRTPELTPELLDNFDVHNADQFQELVRSRLNRTLEYSQRQAARNQVMQQVAGAVKFDLPHDLLVRQSRKTLQRRVMEMRSSGMSDEQIMGRQRVIEQDVVRGTAAALQEHFVLQKIAETEKIEIEDEDLDDEIDRIAEQSGESPRKLRARLERDELMEALATELLERKALDLVLSTAEYEEYESEQFTADEGEVAVMDAEAAPGESEPAALPAGEGTAN